MGRICPHNGSLCPIETTIVTAYEMAESDSKRTAINGLMAAMERQASGKGCDGSVEDDGTVYCANRGLDVMRHVFDIQTEGRGLVPEFPSGLVSNRRA